MKFEELYDQVNEGYDSKHPIAQMVYDAGDDLVTLMNQTLGATVTVARQNWGEGVTFEGKITGSMLNNLYKKVYFNESPFISVRSNLVELPIQLKLEKSGGMEQLLDLPVMFVYNIKKGTWSVKKKK